MDRITHPPYQRKGLHYTSDVTQAISPGWVVNGGCCRAIFRTTRRCSLTSMLGMMTGRWSGSISSCCCRRVRRPVRGEPVGRGDRQPVSQNHRERRAARWNCPRARQKPRPRGMSAKGREPAPAKAGGRKRHIVGGTTGLLVGAEVHAADVQDRDGRCW